MLLPALVKYELSSVKIVLAGLCLLGFTTLHPVLPLMQRDVPMMCNGETGVRLLFCIQSIGSGAIQAYDDYVQARALCKWSIAPRTWLYYRQYTSTENYTSRVYSPDSTRRKSMMHLQTCTQQLHGKGSKQIRHTETLNIQRVGPFTSTGGGDYHDFLLPLETMAARMDHLYLTALGAMPVNAFGEAIGYPPIHIHHTHIGSMSADYELNRLAILNYGNTDPPFHSEPSLPKSLIRANVLDVHGDRQCHSELGGVKCLFYAMPEGFSIRLDTEFFIWGLLNDVRPSDSKQMTWWMEYAVRYESQRSRSLFLPASMGFYWKCDVNGIPGHTEDFDIPAQEPSLMWKSFSFTEHGTFLRNFFHGHHSNVKDIWFVSATPLELDISHFKHEKFWEAVAPSEFGTSLDYLTASLERKLFALTYQWRNGFLTGPPRGMICQTQNPRHEGGFDRFMPARCTMANFFAGQQATLVAFFSPAQQGKMKRNVVTIKREHIIFYFYYQLFSSNTTAKILIETNVLGGTPNCLGTAS